MPRSYNYIYEKMLQDPDDIIGYIAYALYKRSKIEYIKGFKERKEQEPSEEELEEFHTMSCSPENIERLRLQASRLISHILSDNFNMEVEEAKRIIQTKQLDDLKAIVNENKPSFFIGVIQGVFASFIFAGLLTLIALIIKYHGTGLNISIGGI